MDIVEGPTQVKSGEGSEEGSPLGLVSETDVTKLRRGKDTQLRELTLETDNLVNTGYFVFSIDTELAWGFFDEVELSFRTSGAGAKERKSIANLLAALDEFGIVGTWGLVGHLFYERCEECEVCPVREWEGVYPSFAKIYLTNERSWYGADVVDMLLRSKGRHEIAFHGYTHEVFDENTMTRDRARIEVEEWLRVARGRGIAGGAVIFPRGRIGHLELFREHGFTCFRGSDLERGFANGLPQIPGYRRLRDFLSPLEIPCVYDPAEFQESGLVNLPSSRCYFRLRAGIEGVLDLLGLEKVRIGRMLEGVRNAAAQKKAIHIRAHAEQFASDRDEKKLKYFLAHVAEEITRGTIRSVGMSELAGRVTGLG